MRLFNKRQSKITSFSNLSRDTQAEIVLGISQGFKDDYNLDINSDKVFKVFLACGVEVTVSTHSVELVRNDALYQAIRTLLRG